MFACSSLAAARWYFGWLGCFGLPLGKRSVGRPTRARRFQSSSLDTRWLPSVSDSPPALISSLLTAVAACLSWGRRCSGLAKERWRGLCEFSLVCGGGSVTVDFLDCTVFTAASSWGRCSDFFRRPVLAPCRAGVSRACLAMGSTHAACRQRRALATPRPRPAKSTAAG